jgi:signal peptidase II
VKKQSTKIFWLLIPTALIVLLDEWIKLISLQRLPDEGSLIDPGIISFAIHQNFGIAFDIPFKLEFVILISIVIGIGLFHVAYKQFYDQPKVAFAALVIVVGAIGNLYDRIVYDFTVDYIILFGRSAINLSDVIIVTGAILLLLASRKKDYCDEN